MDHQEASINPVHQEPYSRDNQKNPFVNASVDGSVTGLRFLSMSDEEFEWICLKDLLPPFVRLLGSFCKGLIAGKDIGGLHSADPISRW